MTSKVIKLAKVEIRSAGLLKVLYVFGYQMLFSEGKTGHVCLYLTLIKVLFVAKAITLHLQFNYPR